MSQKNSLNKNSKTDIREDKLEKSKSKISSSTKSPLSSPP
jgi:hypothetical protein